MNSTIDRIRLTGLAGDLSGTSAARQTASADGSFLRMAVQLRAGAGSAAPTVPEASGQSMEAYRRSIWEKISQLPLSATRQMESISIQISDAAFERMKAAPEYEAWVLADLEAAFSQSNPWVPACGGGYSIFSIGATKEECHAEGWYPGYPGGSGETRFEERSSGGFWERRAENHKKYRELQQEAAARRHMLMKLRLNEGAAEQLLGLL